MILQVRNTLDTDQVVQLHTRVVQTVIAGSAIRVDTGSDRRLVNYYTSLVNYGFEVSILEADGQEENSFYDAIERIKEANARYKRARSFQDNKIYPPEGFKAREDSSNAKPSQPPVTLEDTAKSRQFEVGKTSNVGNGVVPRTLIDSKLGEIVEGHTNPIPDDFPEVSDPILNKIEADERKDQEDQELEDRKWYKLDELDEDQLKDLLYEKYGESTRLKKKSKIIYYIMELADDAGDDVFNLVDEYKKSKGL